MKAQFKYAFLTGLFFRGPVFAVIFVMNMTFIILGTLGLLPFPAQVTAVSLGGVAIAVMFAANIGGDVAIGRRMFTAPEAYLYALTPVPRRKILLASVIAMAVMDLISMAFVIVCEVWLSLNLAGIGIWQIVMNAFSSGSYFVFILWHILLFIAGYILFMMIILFCAAMKKSFFHKLPAPGFLAVLLAIGCFYIVSLLQLLLAPFGTVSMHGLIIYISSVGKAAFPALIFLILLEAAFLFVLTSKFMERRMNI